MRLMDGAGIRQALEAGKMDIREINRKVIEQFWAGGEI